MSLIKIDLSRYWELLEKKENFETQGKSFRKENKKEYREWFHYLVILEHEVFFQSRESYLPLIQKFVEEKMDPWEFYSFFRDLWSKNLNQIDVLERDWRKKRESTFITDDRAKEFCDCIHYIFDAGEEFNDSDNEEEVNEIANEEEKFRAKVTEVFSKMQEILKKG